MSGRRHAVASFRFALVGVLVLWASIQTLAQRHTFDLRHDGGSEWATLEFQVPLGKRATNISVDVIDWGTVRDHQGQPSPANFVRFQIEKVDIRALNIDCVWERSRPEPARMGWWILDPLMYPQAGSQDRTLYRAMLTELSGAHVRFSFDLEDSPLAITSQPVTPRGTTVGSQSPTAGGTSAGQSVAPELGWALRGEVPPPGFTVLQRLEGDFSGTLENQNDRWIDLSTTAAVQETAFRRVVELQVARTTAISLISEVWMFDKVPAESGAGISLVLQRFVDGQWRNLTGGMLATRTHHAKGEDIWPRESIVRTTIDANRIRFVGWSHTLNPDDRVRLVIERRYQPGNMGLPWRMFPSRYVCWVVGQPRDVGDAYAKATGLLNEGQALRQRWETQRDTNALRRSADVLQQGLALMPILPETESIRTTAADTLTVVRRALSPIDEANVLTRRAESLQQSGDLAGALGALRQAQALYPQDHVRRWVDDLTRRVGQTGGGTGATVPGTKPPVQAGTGTGGTGPGTKPPVQPPGGTGGTGTGTNPPVRTGGGTGTGSSLPIDSASPASVAQAFAAWGQKRGYKATGFGSGTRRLIIQDTIETLGPCGGSAVVIDLNPVVSSMDVRAQVKAATAQHGGRQWSEQSSPSLVVRGEIDAIPVAGLEEAGDPNARHYECVRRAGWSTYMAYAQAKPEYQHTLVIKCGDGWATGNVSYQCPALSLDVVSKWNGSQVDPMPFLQDFIRFYHEAVRGSEGGSTGTTTSKPEAERTARAAALAAQGRALEAAGDIPAAVKAYTESLDLRADPDVEKRRAILTSAADSLARATELLATWCAYPGDANSGDGHSRLLEAAAKTREIAKAGWYQVAAGLMTQVGQCLIDYAAATGRRQAPAFGTQGPGASFAGMYYEEAANHLSDFTSHSAKEYVEAVGRTNPGTAATLAMDIVQAYLGAFPQVDQRYPPNGFRQRARSHLTSGGSAALRFIDKTAVQLQPPLRARFAGLDNRLKAIER